jgi:1-acyl-sn-glycerol-3-phosphate acyltransferase
MWSKLRSYCLICPLLFLYTGIVGTVALFFSLFDRSGRIQHSCARFWAWLILKTALASVQVSGLEHVDITKPHLYAVNHLSAMDIPMLYAHLPFQFRIIAKKELFKYPFLGWHLRRTGQISVDSTSAHTSMRSLNRGVKSLREGMPLVVFPEGGRTTDGTLKPFLPGAFYVAIKTQVEIIPVALVGGYEMLPMNSFHIRPRPLAMFVGEPISSQGYTIREMDKLAAVAQKAVEDLYYPHAEVADPRPTLLEQRPAIS